MCSLSVLKHCWCDVFINYVDSLSLSIFMSITYKYVLVFVDHFIKMRHLVLITSMKVEEAINCFCYEHVWINQSSDLTLIDLIKASHDAMLSLNLAHFYWILQVILSTSSRCLALSSFISFIILLDKHVWHITSHLYRV